MARVGCTCCGQEKQLVLASLMEGNLCIDCYNKTEALRANAERKKCTQQLFDLARGLGIENKLIFLLKELFKRYIVNPDYKIMFAENSATLRYMISYRQRQTPAKIKVGQMSNNSEPTVTLVIEFYNGTSFSIDAYRWSVVSNGKNFKLVKDKAVTPLDEYYSRDWNAWGKAEFVDQFQGSEVEGMFRDVLGPNYRNVVIPELKSFLKPIEVHALTSLYGISDGKTRSVDKVAQAIEKTPDETTRILSSALNKCRRASLESVNKPNIKPQKFPKKFDR